MAPTWPLGRTRLRGPQCCPAALPTGGRGPLLCATLQHLDPAVRIAGSLGSPGEAAAAWSESQEMRRSRRPRCQHPQSVPLVFPVQVKSFFRNVPFALELLSLSQPPTQIPFLSPCVSTLAAGAVMDAVPVPYLSRASALPHTPVTSAHPGHGHTQQDLQLLSKPRSGGTTLLPRGKVFSSPFLHCRLRSCVHHSPVD